VIVNMKVIVIVLIKMLTNVAVLWLAPIATNHDRPSFLVRLGVLVTMLLLGVLFNLETPRVQVLNDDQPTSR
jgi:hypothetical protein